MANNLLLPEEKEQAQLTLFEQIETAISAAFEADNDRTARIHLDIATRLLGILRETVAGGAQ